MSTSYKLALLTAVVLCGFAIGYYAIEDADPASPADAPDRSGGRGAPLADARDAQADRADPAARDSSDADGDSARPQLGTSRSRPAERRAPAPAPEPESAATAPVADTQRRGDTSDEPDDASLARRLDAARPHLTAYSDAGDDVPSLIIGRQPAPVEVPADAPDAPTEASSSPAPDDAAARAEPPADPPPSDSDDSPTIPARYTISSGDTFTSLAVRFYGDQRHWVDIAQANPTVDPARLRVGQEIRLPDVAAVRARSDAPAADAGAGVDQPQETLTYVVRSHDTLSRIAQQHYGDPDKWRVIYEANRERIGADPARIREGMELTLPPAPRGAQ